MELLWFLPAFTLIYISAWYLLSLRVKRWDVIDVAWGPGFIFLVWIAWYFRGMPTDGRAAWIIVLITLWGARLLYHTYRRNLSKDEDWRYHRWHQGSGWRFFLKSYVSVFLFQGALMMIIALPAVYSLSFMSLRLYSINNLGIVLMIVGLLYETLADYQRRVFLQEPINKDRLITYGLWKHSRHPNYFGEMLFWWGLFFIVLGAPKSWMLIVSPLTITYVLLFVSGLPMEERYRGRPDFEEYRRRTSAIIPWFTKKART
ncbi:MAG: DUF1295 domain-containing protein [bacterium]|nr:DUF1295 domain-containing protein [bacterium]